MSEHSAALLLERCSLRHFFLAVAGAVWGRNAGRLSFSLSVRTYFWCLMGEKGEGGALSRPLGALPLSAVGVRTFSLLGEKREGGCVLSLSVYVALTYIPEGFLGCASVL